ncbi:MAG: hypothetical protein M1812_006968 [Candelaria pacifica]|nr:MAG: hypothetical protein M1812_006968 [Candelaria pacifica]
MTPPVANIPLSELEEKIQVKTDGKRRKIPIDLKKCELLEMVQYRCWVEGKETDPEALIICDEVPRLFRRCAGNIMVETTAWEGKKSGV